MVISWSSSSGTCSTDGKHLNVAEMSYCVVLRKDARLLVETISKSPIDRRQYNETSPSVLTVPLNWRSLEGNQSK